jgi:hypothetical protein
VRGGGITGTVRIKNLGKVADAQRFFYCICADFAVFSGGTNKFQSNSQRERERERDQLRVTDSLALPRFALGRELKSRMDKRRIGKSHMLHADD